MKLFFALFLAATVFISCNNESTHSTSSGDKAEADTLYKEVMNGHNIGMAKMPRLEEAQANVRRMLDSIGRLPESSRQASADLKTRLEKLSTEIQQAQDGMNRWMENFNYDSAKNDLSQRIKYLSDEKVRVTKVKEDILRSLQQADSAVRSKF